MLRFLHFFYLGAAVAKLMAVAAIMIVFRQNELRELVHGEEEHNAVIVQALANVIAPRFATAMADGSLGVGPAEDEGENLKALREEVAGLIAGLAVVEVKIFNFDGALLLTHPRPESGRAGGNPKNAGFQAALDTGRPVSRLVYRGETSPFEDRVFDRDIVETYMPVAGRDGALFGILELHTDVSAEVARARQNSLEVGAVLAAVMVILYATIFAVGRRAEKTLVDQYENLRSNERYLQRMIETCPIGVSVSTADDRVMVVNPRLSETLGIPRDELMTVHLKTVFMESEKYEALSRQMDRDGFVHDARVRLRHRDGRERWVELSLERAEFHGQPALIKWAHDITAQRHAEKTREEGERTLLDVIEASPVAVGISDQDGKFLYWNSLFFRMGQQQQDVTGASGFRLAFLDRDLLQQLTQRLEAGLAVENQEAEIALSDGTTAWTLMSMRRMVFEGQTSILTWVYDITNLKLQEEALTQARIQAEEASRAKSDFLATMSHEIRTPMNGVVTMAEMLDRTVLTPEQQDMTAVIRDSAAALLTIIDEILDFSRIEAGKLRLESVSLSLSQVVESVADLLGPRAAEKGLELVACVIEMDMGFMILCPCTPGDGGGHGGSGDFGKEVCGEAERGRTPAPQ